MKKLILAVLLIMLSAQVSFAAGSCTQRTSAYVNGATVLQIACTGDASDGSIPAIQIDMSNIGAGTQYLYLISAYPTAGGTAPDAADVTVTMGGIDLLGGKGVNLIHATTRQDTFPYSAFMTSYRFPVVSGQITVAVANQATVSANYTIELVFVR